MSIVTGYVANSTTVYFGPSSTLYPSQSSSAGPNDTVIIKWQEGNWYYIDYPAGTSNRKCMYIPTSAVSLVSDTPPTCSGQTTSAVMASAATTYWGPGAAYPVAGSVNYNEAVDIINGQDQNGFSLIEYSISSTQKKRAWVMTPKLGIVPTNYNYYTATKNGCSLKILCADAANIVLTNLNRAYTMTQAGYYGVNAGFFNLTGTVDTKQIADNNGFPVLFAARNLTNNGSVNAMGYACLYWDGSTLSFSRNTSSWNQEKVWAQGGIDLQLGCFISNVSSTISGQMAGTYSDVTKRTAICADLSAKKVYMIISTTSCNTSTFRKAITEYFNITETGSLDNNTVAMVMDGGGSTTMICSSYSYDQGRSLVQCMVLK